MTRRKHSEAFVQTIRRQILEEGLLSFGDSVLVGVSGGADSMALIRVLLELREEFSLSLSCAHVNHGFRGEAAASDMEFVRAFCEENGLVLHLLSADVPSYAKAHGLSAEDAGRQIRYRFFTEQSADKIATAHTKDDNAETVLMNLLKGNLPLGIPHKRGRIIRPLLCVSKAEIYAYLERIGQPYVTDATNFSPEYTRNRIRLELIPAICEKFNQNFTNTVYNTSVILMEEQEYLGKLADRLFSESVSVSEDSVRISAKTLCAESPVLARKVLRKCYYLLCAASDRLSYEQTERLAALCHSGHSGQKVVLPGGMVAIRAGEDVYLLQKEPKEFSYPLTKDSPVTAEGYCFTLTTHPKMEHLFSYPIDLKAGDTVTVRSRRAGDRIYLSNLNIHKNVSDFFIDKKIPFPLRQRIPLIVVNDEVRIITGYFYETIPPQSLDTKCYIVINQTSIQKGNPQPCKFQRKT